jgi:protein DEK
MSESTDASKKEDVEQTAVISEKALNGNKEEETAKNDAAGKVDAPKQEEEKAALNNGEAEPTPMETSAEPATTAEEEKPAEPAPAVEEEKQTDASKEETEKFEEKPSEDTNEAQSTETTDSKPDDAAAGGDDKKEEETSKENGEEESSDEEELPPGLLERPIEILKEKRVRKKAARFIATESEKPSPSKRVVEIKEGSGTKIASHPRVVYQLGKNTIEDLKLVHKLFYGLWGDARSCKKNILQFSGFTFDKDSKDYEKKEDYIAGFTLENLKWLMGVCDVKVTGNKDDQLDALMAWCMCPKPSGKDLPNKKKKQKKKSESSSAEGDAAGEEGESSETKKKSPAKKPTKRKSTGDKKTTVKISTPSSAKKAKKTPTSTPNKPPSNAQIVKCVKKILDGANLEEITMKTVCVKVYAQYPKFDLSDRKAFIKETVRKVIS